MPLFRGFVMSRRLAIRVKPPENRKNQNLKKPSCKSGNFCKPEALIQNSAQTNQICARKVKVLHF